MKTSKTFTYALSLLFCGHVLAFPLQRLYKVEVPALSEIRTELESAYASETITQKILKIRITDTANKIATFNELIKDKKVLFRKNDKGNYKKVAKRDLRECSDKGIDCLADILFDKDIFDYQMYLAIKYNIIASTYASGGVPLKLDEIKDVVRALSVLDLEKLKFINQDKYYISMNSGEVDCSVKNPMATLAVGLYDELNLYPLWRCKDQAQRGNTILHELAHMFSAHISMISIFGTKDEYALSSEWTTLGPWKATSRYNFELDKTSKVKECFLSPYSHWDAKEDLAETFMFYVLDSKYVEDKCPDKAAAIKENFFKP